MAEEKKSGGFLRGCLKFVMVVAVLGLLGFLQGIGRIRGAAEAVVEEQRAEAERQIAAPVSDLTWQELNNIYNLKSDFTDLQKEELWKKYKGKKVKWSGEVASVRDWEEWAFLNVIMNPDSLVRDLSVRFEESEKPATSSLQEGDSVVFTGVLDRWGLSTIFLKHGEVIQRLAGAEEATSATLSRAKEAELPQK